VTRALASLSVAVAVVLTAAACNKSSTAPAATTPTPVSRTTDTFTGTVQVKGSDSHSFPVSQTGVVDVTLTAAGPPATIVMGLGVGSLDASSTCVPFAGASTSASAGSNAQLSGTVTAGTLCVVVRDIGNQTGPVSYTVTALHP
jgi:hypothetical protein